ncbi:hypothetical protein [Bergeyella porcorum]|uniref:hypothetical protein n=1 Tax=Bergeyella porcorum TaxID=1735111 RepID=UPI002E2190D7
MSRERFEQLYENYKKDPFGSIRSQIAQIPAEAKMPDGTSMAQLLKDQEAKLKQYLNENNNPVERTSPKGKEKIDFIFINYKWKEMGKLFPVSFLSNLAIYQYLFLFRFILNNVSLRFTKILL